MRVKVLTKRNLKEMLRDPSSLIFGIALPVFLLFLISTIQKSVTVDIFKIEYFAPAMAVFSFSFVSMFSGMLISKDRSSSFLTRLFSSPATSTDYILGYSIPLIPIGILQTIACFATAVCFGLEINMYLIITIFALVPVSILFIAFGILMGSILNDKQVPPIASILVQIAALSSGMWFDLKLIGGVLERVCYALPFSHAVDVARYAMVGDYTSMLTSMLWVLGYTLVIFILAVAIFRKKMKN